MTCQCEQTCNLNRGNSFKLKCSKCNTEFPLSNTQLCPKCKAGILIWTPNNR